MIFGSSMVMMAMTMCISDFENGCDPYGNYCDHCYSLTMKTYYVVMANTVIMMMQ